MNRLKELRNEFKLTVRGLEPLINISSTSISYYEQGTRDFNTNALRTIASFFGVSIDYLLSHSDEGIYVYYEQGNNFYRLDDSCFKKYKDEGLIYYNDNKRYLDINKILGIKKETNVSELLAFINEQDLLLKHLDKMSLAKIYIPLDKVSFVEKVIKLDDDKFKAIRNMIDVL